MAVQIRLEMTDDIAARVASLAVKSHLNKAQVYAFMIMLALLDNSEEQLLEKLTKLMHLAGAAQLVPEPDKPDLEQEL